MVGDKPSARASHGRCDGAFQRPSSRRGSAPDGHDPGDRTVEDKATQTPYPWQERRGLRIYRQALARGVLLRPLGNVVYFMPPYVITEDEIRLLAEVAMEGVDLATSD